MAFRQTPSLLLHNSINNEKIKVINTIKECDIFVEDVRNHLNNFGFRAIGFDCEWVSGTKSRSRSKVSLVQIAMLDPSNFKGPSGLIRLSKLRSVPNSLRLLLGDDTVYKVGVAIAGDAQFLAQDYSVILKSTFDLRFLAISCGYEPLGLAKLSLEVCGFILGKSKNVTCSNWNIDVLSNKQIQYAADDVRSAIQIFRCLLCKLSGIHWDQAITQEQWLTFTNICKPKLNGEYSDREYNIKLAHQTIVFCNVPESTSPHRNIQDDHDRKQVERIIKSTAKIPTDGLKLYRIGPKCNSSTLRRLKVVLKSIEDACKVLKYKSKVPKPYYLEEYIYTGPKPKNKKCRSRK